MNIHNLSKYTTVLTPQLPVQQAPNGNYLTVHNMALLAWNAQSWFEITISSSIVNIYLTLPSTRMLRDVLLEVFDDFVRDKTLFRTLSNVNPLEVMN